MNERMKLMKYVRTMNKRGWYWTPWTYRFDHGGWLFFDPVQEPLATARWLWRFWRGALGCDRHNPSLERYGAFRYTVACICDGGARVRRQVGNTYRFYRLVEYGRSRSVLRSVPDFVYWVRLEARVFGIRMARGRWW